MKKLYVLFVLVLTFSSCYDDENYTPVYYGYSGYTQCRKIEYHDISNDSLIASVFIGDSIPGDGYFARIHYDKLESLFVIQNGFDSCLDVNEFYLINYIDTPYTIRFSSLSSNVYSLWVLDTISFKPEFYNISCN